MADSKTVLKRALEREIAHLRKRKGEVEQRITDMRASVVFYEKQLASHVAELEKLQ